MVEVSYGGLAGRVDAVTLFVIGICQYAYYKRTNLHSKYERHSKVFTVFRSLGI
jgi:hypothetical protein